MPLLIVVLTIMRIMIFSHNNKDNCNHHHHHHHRHHDVKHQPPRLNLRTYVNQISADLHNSHRDSAKSVSTFLTATTGLPFLTKTIGPEAGA